VILHVVERVATWLANGTYGVNALLPGVPRIGADAQPPNVAILDERQHGPAARGQFKRDQSFPVVMVRVPDDVELRPVLDFAVRDAPNLSVLIAYGTKNQDSAAAARDTYYTMTAIERSLQRLWTQGAQSDRTQGTISLVMPQAMRQIKIYAPLVDTVETTAILATYYVRDTSP
jgi:hypothetical protein